jgi:L-amino acid N-acyltransferase YncA
MTPVTVRRAVATDASAIAHIYNQAIAERIATYETELRTAEERCAWLAAHDERQPVLVAELDGQVAGWASVSAYRSRACYDGVGEFSIYIDRGSRGRGAGRVLLEALITEAERAGYWKLLSRVFPFNTGSLALCRACGFREVGLYEKHARLDGRWLDVVIVERLIPANLT